MGQLALVRHDAGGQPVGRGPAQGGAQPLVPAGELGEIAHRRPQRVVGDGAGPGRARDADRAVVAMPGPVLEQGLRRGTERRGDGGRVELELGERGEDAVALAEPRRQIEGEAHAVGSRDGGIDRGPQGVGPGQVIPGRRAAPEHTRQRLAPVGLGPGQVGHQAVRQRDLGEPPVGSPRSGRGHRGRERVGGAVQPVHRPPAPGLDPSGLETRSEGHAERGRSGRVAAAEQREAVDAAVTDEVVRRQRAGELVRPPLGPHRLTFEPQADQRAEVEQRGHRHVCGVGRVGCGLTEQVDGDGDVAGPHRREDPCRLGPGVGGGRHQVAGGGQDGGQLAGGDRRTAGGRSLAQRGQQRCDLGQPVGTAGRSDRGEVVVSGRDDPVAVGVGPGGPKRRADRPHPRGLVGGLGPQVEQRDEQVVPQGPEPAGRGRHVGQAGDGPQGGAGQRLVDGRVGGGEGGEAVRNGGAGLI